MNQNYLSNYKIFQRSNHCSEKSFIAQENVWKVLSYVFLVSGYERVVSFLGLLSKYEKQWIIKLRCSCFNDFFYWMRYRYFKDSKDHHSPTNTHTHPYTFSSFLFETILWTRTKGFHYEILKYIFGKPFLRYISFVVIVQKYPSNLKIFSGIIPFVQWW